MGAVWSFWTEHETNILKLRWWEPDHVRRISKLTGRSRRAVRARGTYLGLPSKRPYALWNEEQDDYLRQNYHIITAREIAHTLKKSRDSVIGRAFRLGLGHKKRCTLSDRCITDTRHIVE